MKIGLVIPEFTLPEGPAELGPTLARMARTADQGGFSSLAVMDHLFQIRMYGPPHREMLEAYATLAFLAGHTKRIRLGAMVTGVVYRHPGVLVKTVTTLDVLSQGRAWLGIGAAWNQQECRALGVPFPPLGERFERLEETLQVCLRMWSGDESPFQGDHFQLRRPLNSPQSLTRPHPPILVGGGGERKTLRLVARYADACNLYAGPQVAHKLDVLRRHCEAEGRDFEDIERTALLRLDVGDRGEKAGRALGMLRWLAGMGIQTAHVSVRDAHTIAPLEAVAEHLIPAAAEL